MKKTLAEAIQALRMRIWHREAWRLGALLLLFCACAATFAQGLNPGGPIDFGTVAVGASPKVYTLTFSATVPTDIQSVNALTNGAANEDFSVLSQTCVGPQAPPQSCTIEVGFSPTAPGLRRGALVLTDSTGAVVNRIYLHGIGDGAQMVVTPPAVSLLGALPLSPAQFSASAVAVDGAGAVYFNDVTYTRLLKRDAAGTVTQIAVLPTRADSAMALDGSGTLYISAGAVVYSLAPGGSPVPLSTGSNALVDARGIAVDGLGYVYIADAQLNRIVRVGPDGSSAVLALSGLSSPLSQPSGLVIGAANNLYIADTGNNRIVVAGLYTGTTSVVTAGFSAPQGVVVDPAGSLAVTDTGNRRVLIVPASGAPFPLAIAGVTLQNPIGIALSDDARLFVADSQVGVLTLVRNAGTVTFPTPTHVKQLDATDGVLPFQVLNTGNVPLQLFVPSTGTNPSLTWNAFAFSNTGGTCPLLTPASPADATTQLVAGQTCNYGLSFTPQVASTNSDTATLTATPVGGGTALTRVVNIAGTGVSNTVSFSVVATPSITQPGSPVSFTVTALNSSGVADSTYLGTVTFSTSDPAARFLSGTSYAFITADAGVHTFTAPSSGIVFNTLGTFVIKAQDATAAGTSNPVQVAQANGFTVTATPNAVTLNGNVALSITATFNGVPATNYTGTVTLSATDPAAKFLSGTTYTFTAADKGTHTFPAAAGVQFNTLGTFTIGVTDGLFSATSNAVQVLNADSFVVTATPSTTTMGSPVSFTVTAMLRGSVATSFTGTVTFTTQDSAAKFLSGTSYTFTAADHGTHTFTAPSSGVQFNTPGTFTVVAAAGSLSGTSNTVTVQGVNGFTITATPSTLPVGGSAGFTVTATNNGNLVPGYTGTVTLSATDPAAKFLSGITYTFTAADKGTHTFPAAAGVQFNTLGTFTIGATDGTNNGTSNPVRVVAATGLAVTATPSTTTLGSPVSFTVTAVNNGAPAPSFTGPVTFTTNDPAARFLNGATYTFTAADNGTHTFTAPASGVQFNTGGTFTVVATAGALTGISNPVQVLAPTTLTVVASPSVTSLGVPVSFTVSATNGNVVIPGYTGTVTFSATDPAAKFLGGTSYTFTAADRGTHTFAAPASGVQLNTLGTWTVSATDGVLTGTSNGVQVLGITGFSVTASPSTTTVGTPVSFTVTAMQSGSAATSFTGPVTFTTADPQAKFLAGTTYTFTAADNGTHTFTAPAAGVQFNSVGSFAVTASDGGITGSSNAVTVTSTATVTLASSSSPVLTGTAVTLSATVAGPGGIPTGTVVFLDGSTPLQTVPLVNGTATATVAFSTLGTHTLTAAYSGDASFPPAVSAALPELVEDFSLTLASGSSSSASVLAGHPATYSLVLTPLGGSGLAAPVTLTATGAPPGAKVSLTPASVAAGAGATPVTLTITPGLVTATAHERPASGPGRTAAITLALMFLPIAGFVRRRRLVVRLLVLALAVLPFTALTGCLSATQDGYYGSAPQHYTVIVTATSGSDTHTFDVTLTVQ